jgi:hypothetical protein
MRGGHTPVLGLYEFTTNQKNKAVTTDERNKEKARNPMLMDDPEPDVTELILQTPISDTLRPVENLHPQSGLKLSSGRPTAGVLQVGSMKNLTVRFWATAHGPYII